MEWVLESIERIFREARSSSEMLVYAVLLVGCGVVAAKVILDLLRLRTVQIAIVLIVAAAAVFMLRR